MLCTEGETLFVACSKSSNWNWGQPKGDWRLMKMHFKLLLILARQLQLRAGLGKLPSVFRLLRGALQIFGSTRTMANSADQWVAATLSKQRATLSNMRNYRLYFCLSFNGQQQVWPVWLDNQQDASRNWDCWQFQFFHEELSALLLSQFQWQCISATVASLAWQPAGRLSQLRQFDNSRSTCACCVACSWPNGNSQKCQNSCCFRWVACSGPLRTAAIATLCGSHC